MNTFVLSNNILKSNNIIENTLQWCEKYRPVYINDIIGHTNNIEIIKKILKNNLLPHLLFYGPPGTGKTTTIMTLINHIYGDDSKLMVLKLDASDDRGINSVREEIKGFADKKNMFSDNVQIIILDEVDSMTYDAQFALRRIIEKYSKNIRFCLICNYDNKIITAIKSRCFNFRFNYMDKNNIVIKLKNILCCENIIINDDLIESIAYISKGDLRKAINILQTISFYENGVTVKECYNLYGFPCFDDIRIIYIFLTNQTMPFNEKYDNITLLFHNNNYSFLNLINELTLYIVQNNLLFNNYKLLIELANLEIQVLKIIHIEIYISVLISIFIS